VCLPLRGILFNSPKIFLHGLKGPVFFPRGKFFNPHSVVDKTPKNLKKRGKFKNPVKP